MTYDLLIGENTYFSMVITEGGKLVAALIDIELFERLRTLDEEYAPLRGDL